MVDLNWRTLAGAAFTWLIPLAVSFGLYNPQTDVYLPNYIGFKVIMAALAAMACYLTYRWIQKNAPLMIGAPVAYVALNSVLDILLLVLVFGVAFSTWATTILPIYAVVFFGLYFALRR